MVSYLQAVFFGNPIAKGAIKFAALACPLAWSFMVLAVAAKHHMTSTGGFILIETAFIVTHYAIVSPFIAALYAHRDKNS